MKYKNIEKKDIEKGDLIKFTRQCGKTKLTICKMFGIPIKIEKVNI